MFLFHYNGHSAAFVSPPRNFVHKRTHEQQPASGGFQQICRVGRVRDLVRIEPDSEILDRDLKFRRRIRKQYFDVFAFVKFIAMLYGICDRFANG